MNSTSGPSNLVRHHQPLRSIPQNSAVDFDLSDEIPCGTFRLTFGSNFVSNKPDNEYHTLKFDIKPSSAHENAFLSFDDKKDAIKVTIPSDDGHSVYKGTSTSQKIGRECILLFNGSNLRIEKVSSTSTVKHVRSEGSDDVVDVELLKKQAEAAKPWVPPTTTSSAYDKPKKPFWAQKLQTPSSGVVVPKPVVKKIIPQPLITVPEALSEESDSSSDDETMLLKQIGSMQPEADIQRPVKRQYEDNSGSKNTDSPKKKPDVSVSSESSTKTVLMNDLDLSDSSDDSDCSSDDEAMNFALNSLEEIKKTPIPMMTENYENFGVFSDSQSAASTTIAGFSRPMSAASRFSVGTTSCGPSPLLRTPGGSSGPSPSLTRTPGSSGPSPLLLTPGSTSSGPSPSLRPPSASFSSHSSTSGCSSFATQLTPISSVLSADLQLSESSSDESDQE
uniref:Ell-associated factor Eaf n=1 Tax=Panagrolaimus sp. JU765 TaxID=591449 RepID=A0AC34QJ72_9BILA